MSPDRFPIALAALACASGIASSAFFSWIGSEAPPPAAAAVADERVAALESRLDELRDERLAARGALDASLGELRASLAALELRAREVDERAQREPVAPPTAQPPERSEPQPPSHADGAAQLRAMLGSVLGHEGARASTDDEARFWELVRTGNALSELLVELEGDVERSPHDVRARLALAQGYVAKLLSVPGGPERGIWGARAEEQWKEAARLEPDCWEARFALGENYSYYPSFLNKSGAALDELQAARAIQEGRPIEPRFAQTYLLIARVHSSRAEEDGAREALEAGLALFPDDAALQEALAALGE